MSKELAFDSPEQWQAEARKRFGDDPMNWAFVCPSCHSRQTVNDYREAGAPEGAVAFSCIGRWKDDPAEAFTGENGRYCNYAGGGLIGLNPVVVGGQRVFAFAEPTAPPAPEATEET